VVVTVPSPAGSVVGVVVNVAVTGDPIRIEPVAVAPAIGVPEGSVSVTVIVSFPIANPVESNVPRSTVVSVVNTCSVTATGWEVKRTLCAESVTV